MTSKSFKRWGALLLVCILLVVSSTTAFASTNTVSETGKVEIKSGQTVPLFIATFEKPHTVTVEIQTSGLHLFGDPTISWGIHKAGEPNFMSGETLVGDTFSSSGHNLDSGSYYIEITNNSAFTVTVNVRFIWYNQ